MPSEAAYLCFLIHLLTFYFHSSEIDREFVCHVPARDLPVVTLHGQIGTDEFRAFHGHLASLCEKGQARYVFRHAPGDSDESLHTKIVLAGYGVSLDIKNMEYKTLDDLAPAQANTTECSAAGTCAASDAGEDVGSQSGFIMGTLLNRKPKLAKKLEEFSTALKAEIASKQQINAWDLNDIGLAAIAQITANNGTDSLQKLADLSQNFPLRAGSLVGVQIPAALRKQCETDSTKELQPYLSINGKTVKLPGPADMHTTTPDVFSILHQVRYDAAVINKLSGTGVDLKQFKALSLQTAGSTGERRIDCRTGSKDAVHFLNDLAKDDSYREWESKTANLLGEQQRQFLKMQQLPAHQLKTVAEQYQMELKFGPTISKNLITLHFVTDPTDLTSYQAISTALFLLRGNHGVRLGISFAPSSVAETDHLPEAASAEQLSALLVHIKNSHGALVATNFVSLLGQHREGRIRVSQAAEAYAAAAGNLSTTEENLKAEAQVVIDQISGNKPCENSKSVECRMVNFVARKNLPVPCLLINGRATKLQQFLTDEMLFADRIHPRDLTIDTKLSFAEVIHPLLVAAVVNEQMFIMGKLQGGTLTSKTNVYQHLLEGPSVRQKFHYLLNDGKPEGAKPRSALKLFNFLAESNDLKFKTASSPGIVMVTLILAADLTAKGALDAATTLRDHVENGCAGENCRATLLPLLPAKGTDASEITAAVEVMNSWGYEVDGNSGYMALATRVSNGLDLPAASVWAFTNGESYQLQRDASPLEWATLQDDELQIRAAPARELVAPASKKSKKSKSKSKAKAKAKSADSASASPEEHSRQIAQLSALLVDSAGHFTTPTGDMSADSFPLSDPTVIHIGSNSSTASLQVHAVIDPLSSEAQFAVSVLKLLSQSFDAVVSLKLFTPTVINPDHLPKRFFRWVGPTKPQRSINEAVSSTAIFTELPANRIFTATMHTIQGWDVQSAAVVPAVDLDNVQLDGADSQVDVQYMLKAFSVCGVVSANDSSGRCDGCGAHFELVDNRNSEILSRSTAIGFSQTNAQVQLSAAPGIWKARPAGVWAGTGKTVEIVIRSLVDRGPHSFELKPEARRKSEVATAAQGVENDDGLIHVFSLASGHLYERFLKVNAFLKVNTSLSYIFPFLKIMMLSVSRRSSRKVKFWLIETFLSPEFKKQIRSGSLQRKFGYEIGLVTYAWPASLRQQRTKQRLVWAYKILFLDVLFPASVKRIVFVDADQVVRSDLNELWEIDLKGSVYGFTPFCSSRKETLGYQFWRQGYWKQHLGEKPYHISALFVVDLVAFRKKGAGELLRSTYEQLTHDPNALSNLDQVRVLPQCILTFSALIVVIYSPLLFRIFRITCSLSFQYSACLRSGCGAKVGARTRARNGQKQSICAIIRSTKNRSSIWRGA
jgi:UDP-glucose:glycoprotein glucosyltransferase